MIKKSEISEYTDCYFTKSREGLDYANHNPILVWQIFQKTNAIFCGVPFIEEFFEDALEVHTLPEGSEIAPHETAMLVKAYAQSFVEYETVHIGVLARCTRVATNVRAAVNAANGKPVLFFPARFDVPETQVYDGYAAAIGGAAGCATKKQTEGFGRGLSVLGKQISAPLKPVGTMPHFQIAAFGGDTVEAALAFAYSRPDEDVWVLVDFHNDCAKTSVEVFKAFQQRGIEHRLKGVRLDTSEKLVDVGIASTGLIYDNGVTVSLAFHVRRELDSVGGQAVKIAVSGGFTPEKIKSFENASAPVDVYAIGEGFLKGSTAFTSDVVIRMDGNNIVPSGKIGRPYKPSTRLQQLKGVVIPT